MVYRSTINYFNTYTTLYGNVPKKIAIEEKEIAFTDLYIYIYQNHRWYKSTIFHNKVQFNSICLSNNKFVCILFCSVMLSLQLIRSIKRTIDCEKINQQPLADPWIFAIHCSKCIRNERERCSRVLFISSYNQLKGYVSTSVTAKSQ